MGPYEHPASFLVAGPVFFLCLPYFSQSKLRGGVVIQKITSFRVEVHNLRLSNVDNETFHPGETA
eukprot:1146196-Pelagomonas_calceolata.AAC.2